MMGSLQDQLVKAGLAKESQARKSKPKKSAGKSNKAKPKPDRRRSKGKADSAEVSLAAAYAQRAKTEKKERTLSGKRKQLEDERRRKVNLQLKAIIPPAAKNEEGAEQERFVEYKGKIRKLYVTTEQQQALNEGQLGIVYLQGRHYIVEPAVVEKVRTIQAENVSLDPKQAGSAAES